MTWNVLAGGWLLRCPNENVSVVVELGHFRELGPFEGARRPPVFALKWKCARCEQIHVSLLTSEDLDFRPIQEMIPPVYIADTKKYEWVGDIQNTDEQIRHGHWPLTLPCLRCFEKPAWPTLIRHIEPDRLQEPTSYLVHHQCSTCNKERVSEQRAISFRYPRVRFAC